MKIFQFNIYTNVYLITSFILGIILMGISFSGTNSIFLNLTGLFLILFFFIYILFIFIINKLNSKINWNKFFKPTKIKLIITIIISFLFLLFSAFFRNMFTILGVPSCIDGLVKHKNLFLFFLYDFFCFPKTISLFLNIINIITLFIIIYLLISFFFIKKTKIRNETSSSYYRIFGEILILILTITILISLISPLSSLYYINKYSQMDYRNYVQFDNIPNPTISNPIEMESVNVNVPASKNGFFGIKILNTLNETVNLSIKHGKNSPCEEQLTPGDDEDLLRFSTAYLDVYAGEVVEIAGIIKTEGTDLEERNQIIGCPIIIKLNGKNSNLTHNKIIRISSR